MSKQVILIGGIYHPFEDYAALLTRLGSAAGWRQCLVTDDVDAAIEALEPGDLLALAALRWRMLNHEKYVPHRARWAFELSPDKAAALTRFVHGGGRMLAMHTASICFDTFAGYGELLGGRWVWDQTFHPDPCALTVTPQAHPITEGLQDFTLHDELYHHLAVEPTSTPLLRARIGRGEWHTVSWAAQPGSGRVVYNALGHDRASWQQPQHQQFLRSSLMWLRAGASV